MTAFRNAMTMTTITPSTNRSTVMLGRNQAATQNEIDDTIRVMSSRLMSAHRPPRHSQRIRSWAEYR
jgi:hypothetical protein